MFFRFSGADLSRSTPPIGLRRATMDDAIMREGRIKNTRRGIGSPEAFSEPAEPPRGIEGGGPEPVVPRVVAMAPPQVTPSIEGRDTVPERAKRRASAGAAAAAAYVEPKTPPPVHAEQADLMAVLLSDDIHPQKVPTEPSLSRLDSRVLADISSLPPVEYRSSFGQWPWVGVALLGGLLGLWVYLASPEAAVRVDGQKASVTAPSAGPVNPVVAPQKNLPKNEAEPIASAAHSATPEPSKTAEGPAAAARAVSESTAPSSLRLHAAPEHVTPKAAEADHPDGAGSAASSVAKPAPLESGERPVSGAPSKGGSSLNSPSSEFTQQSAASADKRASQGGQKPSSAAPSSTGAPPAQVWLE